MGDGLGRPRSVAAVIWVACIWPVYGSAVWPAAGLTASEHWLRLIVRPTAAITTGITTVLVHSRRRFLHGVPSQFTEARLPWTNRPFTESVPHLRELTSSFAESVKNYKYSALHACMQSAASVFAVSNYSPHVCTQSILSLAKASSFLMIPFTSLPVATLLTSSTKDRPTHSKFLSSTLVINLDVYIMESIGETGEPCDTPASTRHLPMTLPSISIWTVWSESNLGIHLIRSPSICLLLSVRISLPLPTLGNAAVRYQFIVWPLSLYKYIRCMIV